MQHETIATLLEQGAGAHGPHLAIADLAGRELSYDGLDHTIRAGADALWAAGVRADDRVGIVLPNGPEAAVAFLAVASVATAAPLNPNLTRAELVYYLDDLDARAVVVLEQHRNHGRDAAEELRIPVIELVADEIARSSGPGWLRATERSRGPDAEQRPSPRPDDVALVLHTSGTTAKPKIVPLTHANLCCSAHNVATTLQLGPGDRCMNVMPLFHIHGLVAALLSSLSSGASVVCTPGFEAPSFFEWFAQVRPTWYTAVPTMHQAVLARAGDEQRAQVRESPLRFIRSSSASLAPSVLAEVEGTFDVPVIEAYGMTEAAHQMTSNPLPPRDRRPGSVGPAAGPEVAIADERGALLPIGRSGEVVIRGANVTAGYVGGRGGDAFFGDGWFRTGDLGHLDQDGYLYLSGRKKEIINRGGETIAPRSIDEAILLHPGVAQAVAFAVPDPALGEEVAAAVVLADGAELTETSIQKFLADHLSWNRMPKRILIVESIPKGPTGKLQRIGLAAQLGLESVHREHEVDDSTDAARSDGTPAEAEVTAGLLALWRDVLKNPDIDADANFLDAGGDSVTATALAVRAGQEFGVDVPLLDFFSAPTVRRQASLIAPLVARDDD